MKVSMKYWKIGAYFGSIALAVGIGMVYTTAREKTGGEACNYRVSDQPSCMEIIGNKDEDPKTCTGSLFAAYAISDIKSTKLFKTMENASACVSCKEQGYVRYDMMLETVEVNKKYFLSNFHLCLMSLTYPCFN
jgi:hypothetical protein